MLALILLAPHLRILRRKRQLTYRPPRSRRYYGARAINPIERLSRILDERIRYPEVDEVGSLAGMLRHGSLQSRYKALETVVTSFEPRLSPLIIIALSDEDQTIRALAAAAAAQISYNLTQQRQELEAKIAPSQNMDDRYALAILLADHGCHNQLLPHAQRMRLCQEAAAQVREIAKMLPEGDVRQRPLRTISSQVMLEMIHHKDVSPTARVQPLEVAT
jgi:HEAT repeat protein